MVYLRDAREDGLSIRKIATRYRMSTRTVQDILKDAA
jgi:transposase